ncbi:hypothetical protein ACOMHN_052036 [Nucella lapillus]
MTPLGAVDIATDMSPPFQHPSLPLTHKKAAASQSDEAEARRGTEVRVFLTHSCLRSTTRKVAAVFMARLDATIFLVKFAGYQLCFFLKSGLDTHSFSCSLVTSGSLSTY